MRIGHRIRILTALLIAAVPLLASCQKDQPAYLGEDPHHGKSYNLPSPELGLPPTPVAKTAEPAAFPVPPPPFTEGIFPCSDCHGAKEPVNRTRRPLTKEHAEIALQHDAENRWCLDCHSAENRDMLHLASGELIDFKESYRLCGQCHGPTLRDWKKGIHGKRTGMWNGKKEYLLCIHCHNPHSPRFKPLKPEAPPPHPEDVK